ncbi:MAG: hypothetical protein AAB795_02070 [Patescibacteria group bacterium]
MVEEQIQIIFHKTRNDDARQYEQDEIRALLWRLSKKLHSRFPITSIEVGVDFPKNMAGKGKSYDITLKLTLASGDVFVSHGKSKIAKVKGVGLGTAVREGFKDIEAQYRKTKTQ